MTWSGCGFISSARVVASDFYRGKVKSIYEREPLWQEFSSSVSGKGYNMYNSEHLSNIKNDFKGLVEDKYRRVRYLHTDSPSGFRRKVRNNFGASVRGSKRAENCCHF